MCLVSYVVCETVSAAVLHLRKECDSFTLCGHKSSWDTKIDGQAFNDLNHGVCRKCRNIRNDKSKQQSSSKEN